MDNKQLRGRLTALYEASRTEASLMDTLQQLRHIFSQDPRQWRERQLVELAIRHAERTAAFRYN